ncbi:MAG: hypothetical protein ACI9J3_000682 [Parvicellaceae bacterium]|jgi:hypothetical protein
MNEEHTEAIKKILIQWNPLGERASTFSDLDEYYSESTDILFHINTELHFKKSNDPKHRVNKIVKEVLNEAFDLHLTDKECEKPSGLIFNLLQN